MAKAIAHGVVAEVSARVAGNKPGSGFYAGVTNEALIGDIQKVAKTNPAVAQWLSAGVGAVVNAGLGKPIITGAAEAQYGTRENAYGRMKQPNELSVGESYYIIALNGGVYKRSSAGDDLVDPSVLSTDHISGVVVQNPQKGHQLEGQEVFINSDLSWTNIDEPMGKVHVGAAGWLVNNTSSWDNPSVNNPAVVEEIPRVIDEWPEESTGKIYRVYSNSSEPVFTGEYQGNQFLKAGYKPQWVESGGYWIANGWYINLNDESRKLISESLSGGVGENNTIAMNTLKWTTSKVGRDLGILSDREESASLFFINTAARKGNSSNSVIYTNGVGVDVNLSNLLSKIGVKAPKIIYNNTPNEYKLGTSVGAYTSKVIPNNSDIDLERMHFKIEHTNFLWGGKSSQFQTINDVDYALGEDNIDINSNTLHALAPRMTPGKIKSKHRSKTHSMPVEISFGLSKSVEEYGPLNSDQLALVKKVYGGLPYESQRAAAFEDSHPDFNGEKWINLGNNLEYYVAVDKDGRYKILLNEGWRPITKEALQSAYRRKE